MTCPTPDNPFLYFRSSLEMSWLVMMGTERTEAFG
jgi:hypothetical protein